MGAGGASVGGTDNNNNDDDDEEEKEEEDDDDVDENNLSISTCYNKDIHYMTLFITCTWNTYSNKKIINHKIILIIIIISVSCTKQS